MYKVEICANSVESCLAAQQGGAYRVELCAGIPEGGTTPSYGQVVLARKLLDIKLHVIIRPRAGDFLYTAVERNVMLEDIEMVRRLGADGIVVGCLTSCGDIDLAFLKEMKQAAGELPVTFHRAFDVCRDPREALENIIEAGCNRLLTSGQMPGAEQGIPLIKKLVDQAGDRMIIMPGCGINEDNICRIAQETGAKEFHFSAREEVPSRMEFRNPSVSMGGVVRIDEYAGMVTSVRRVRETLRKLNDLHEPELA